MLTVSTMNSSKNFLQKVKTTMKSLPVTAEIVFGVTNNQPFGPNDFFKRES